MITETAVVKAAVAIAAPLISKEEHIAGEKVLQLAFKWGEPVAVKLVAIGWKRLRSLAALVSDRKLSHEDHVEQLLNETIIPQTDDAGTNTQFINRLDAGSLAKLTAHMLALNFGEVKSPQMPATDPVTAPATGGTSSVGQPASN